MSKFEILILAAGRGSRMKTIRPKLFNKIKGTSIIDLVIKKALGLKASKVNVIINKNYKQIKKKYPSVNFFYQLKPLGTGHAVQTFLKKRKINKDLLIMMGDAPLINTLSIKKIIKNLKKKCNYILGAKIRNNSSHGVIKFEGKKVTKIIEFNFLKEFEKKNSICNTGIFAIKKENLELIKKIKKNPVKKEYLLTDLVNIFYKTKICLKVILTSPGIKSFGINNQNELEKFQ